MASRGAQRDETIAAIGAAIDGAQDAPILAHSGDPLAGDGEDGMADAPPLPPGCPVTCLGINGQHCFYLDYCGQVVSLKMGTEHGKNNLAGLFGPKIGWLEQQGEFQQWSKPVRERIPGTNQWETVIESVVIGFDQAKVSRALIVECTRKGIFNPAGRIKGAGAHRDDNGGLILHCGDQVMRRELRLNGAAREIAWHRPGKHGEHVFTAADRIPRPWHERAPERAGELALALIKCWRWRRAELDPLLVLGGIGASLIGGALEWRGNVWITGGSGSGKSTLNGKHGALAEIFGRGAVRAADASAAYLRQRLRNATLPVFLDELEAEKDDRRTRQILELARVSSSGDDSGRGGADHNAAEFTLQSAFWASSILIPAMEPQDRNRWAFCQLMPLPTGEAGIKAKADLKAAKGAARLPELGQKLLRRMVDGWERWQATYEAYQDALGDLGHSARGCAQFGTLLAAADLLLYDDLILESVRIEAAKCAPKGLREVAEASPEHELCLNHLRTSMVQARGGEERESIGTWIGAAVQEIVDPAEINAFKHHKRLQEHGLKLVRRTETGAGVWQAGERGYLAVANAHQAVAGLFAGQKWAGGVWAQALGYTPGSIEGIKVKFNKSSLTATLVPLEAVIDESEIPALARWASEGGEA